MAVARSPSDHSAITLCTFGFVDDVMFSHSGPNIDIPNYSLQPVLSGNRQVPVRMSNTSTKAACLVDLKKNCLQHEKVPIRRTGVLRAVTEKH